MKEIDKNIMPETADDYKLAKQAFRLLQHTHRNLTQEEKDTMWMTVQKKCSDKKTAHKSIILWTLSTAACIAAAIGLFGLYHPASEKQKTIAEYAIENIARPDSVNNDIQIILSDNEKIALKEKTAEIIYDESGQVILDSQTASRQKNDYIQQEKDNKQIAYNQVIVPKGKHSTLTLSDGSKLSLNSSSRVVYPPVFADNKREIYIEGEVYIDVKPDKKRPFILKTNKIEVQVTGTSFNVMAYDDEASQEVVLVEGSVSVRVKGKSEKETTLHPNQMFSLTEKEITVKTVEVVDHISWKDGYYLSKYDKLSLILSKLSHYYGIEIRYGQEVGNIKFTGKLDLKDDPDRVMFGLRNTASINCRKENEIYIITPSK